MHTITIFDIVFNVACFLLAMLIWQILEGPVHSLIYLVKYFFFKKPDPVELPTRVSVMPVIPGWTPQERHTTITEFIVIKPTNEMETVGEILKLSQFGEYCPDNSLRGYQLFYLLTHPQNYCIKTVIQKGHILPIEPPIAAGTVAENNFTK